MISASSSRTCFALLLTLSSSIGRRFRPIRISVMRTGSASRTNIPMPPRCCRTARRWAFARAAFACQVPPVLLSVCMRIGSVVR